MDTLWLILFLLSMVAGIVYAVKLILSIFKTKKKENRKRYLIGLIVCIIIYFSSALFLDTGDYSDSTSTDNTIGIESTSAESNKIESDEPNLSKVETENTEGINSEEDNEKSINSDLELLTREGHPRYYGSTTEAHKIWETAPKGKIVFADSNSKYSEKNILSMRGYSQGEKNEIIRSIGINFYNFDEPTEITLENALEIADGYIPYDIIAQWYEFANSYCLVPKDNKDETCYTVRYHLTDKGKETYRSNEHAYSGSIDIIFYMNTETQNVNSISIGFGTPKWMGFLDTNGYEKTEWEFDFCKK